MLDIESAATSRFEAAGEWALRFPAKPNLKFHAVLRGECWITLAGQQACPLRAGDTFFLANSPPFVLASDPQKDIEGVDDASQIFGEAQSHIYRYGGDDVVLLGGSFVFHGGNARLLLDSLPSIVHIPSTDATSEVLRRTLELLDSELGGGQMGASLMARRLADVLLVQALRAYVSVYGAESAGWIGALNDRALGAALTLLHSDVSHDWRVGELASAVGMSRSGFAAHFKSLIGIPPGEYLLQWRMQLARIALRRDETSVASLANSLGYASESAFGNAFKRVFGKAPKRYWAKADDPE